MLNWGLNCLAVRARDRRVNFVFIAMCRIVAVEAGTQIENEIKVDLESLISLIELQSFKVRMTGGTGHYH